MAENLGQTLKVNEMINLMVNYAGSVYQVDGNFKKVQPIMLWGPPGIGKSDLMKQVVKKLGAKFNKTTDIRDVRLLLFNPVDLRGIPVPSEEEEIFNNPSQENVEIVKHKVAKWLRPQLFSMNSSSEYMNFLVLDEISAAPPTVQAAAYQITLDRQIGEHKLPDNCLVMCAGNEVTDKSVAYKMPKALANRLAHLKIKVDIEDWKQWALPNGVSEKVVGYLNYQNSMLHQFDPNSDDNAFPTPRSWHKVSDILKYMDSVDSAMPLIAGLIGEGNSFDFYQYTKLYSKLPNPDFILDGDFKKAPVPNSPDIMFALCSSLTARALKCAETIKTLKDSNEIKTESNKIENIFKYTLQDNFSAEYAVLLARDILRLDSSIQTMMAATQTFLDFSKKYKFILGATRG